MLLDLTYFWNLKLFLKKVFDLINFLKLLLEISKHHGKDGKELKNLNQNSNF